MASGEFEVTFTIPGAPRGKGAGRAAIVGGHAHVFTDEKTRSEMGMIRMVGKQAMGNKAPYEGQVTMMITAYRDPPKSFSKIKRAAALAGAIRPASRPDCDNHSKLVCDALNKVVFKDDCQITDLIVLKRYDEVPRLVVAINSV